MLWNNTVKQIKIEISNIKNIGLINCWVSKTIYFLYRIYILTIVIVLNMEILILKLNEKNASIYLTLK